MNTRVDDNTNNLDNEDYEYNNNNQLSSELNRTNDDQESDIHDDLEDNNGNPIIK